MDRPEQAASSEQAMSSRVGFTLLGGLLLSIAVMIVGLILSAIRGGNTKRVLPLDQVLPRLAAGHAPAVLDMGILILFATPLAGVVVALFWLLRARDYLFASTTGLLLIMVAVAVAVALH